MIFMVLQPSEPRISTDQGVFWSDIQEPEHYMGNDASTSVYEPDASEDNMTSQSE
jgi:hypothetical protein